MVTLNNNFGGGVTDDGVQLVKTDDSRLTDARTPTAHKTSHQDGGADEISVNGLSGTLADPQTAAAHAASHKNGGAASAGGDGTQGMIRIWEFT